MATKQPPKGVELHQGEEVLAVMQPSPGRWWANYFFSLGFAEIWRRKHFLLLTNERLLFHKGVLNKTQRSIPLARLQDATFKSNLLLGGGVVISSAGGGGGTVNDTTYKKTEARAFVDLVNEEIRQHQGDGLAARAPSAPAPSGSADAGQSLQQLEALKEQGLLTDEEYAEKRQEILKRL